MLVGCSGTLCSLKLAVGSKMPVLCPVEPISGSTELTSVSQNQLVGLQCCPLFLKKFGGCTRLPWIPQNLLVGLQVCLNPYRAYHNYCAFEVTVHKCWLFLQLPFHLCHTFLGRRNCWQAPCLHTVLIRKIPTVPPKLYVNKKPKFCPTFWCQI